MHTIIVELKEREYPIYVTVDGLNQFASHFDNSLLGKKVAIITNEKVGALYLSQLTATLKEKKCKVYPIKIEDGEQYKSQETVNQIYDRLIAEKFERSSTIIALGGGVIGDVAGFAASTLLRGINFIQVPTTLLAQTDASIGGKVGINHGRGKNLIGSFYQPQFVYVDVKVLETLDKREFISGLAEVIKYGMIQDEKFFTYLEENIESILNLEMNSVLHIVETCCRIKADIVGRDELEQGVRSLLNYGHTFAHAIENLTEYKVYKHGEAVMMGMLMAGKTAVLHGILSQENFDRQNRLILKIYFPKISSKLKTREIIKCMSQDKKIKEEKLRFILTHKVGQAELFSDVPLNTVKKSIDWFLSTVTRSEH